MAAESLEHVEKSSNSKKREAIVLIIWGIFATSSTIQKGPALSCVRLEEKTWREAQVACVLEGP